VSQFYKRAYYGLHSPDQGWISWSNLRPTLEICALRPFFLNIFNLIWHLAFAPCAQLFALPPRFLVRSMLYALRPTFMKSTPGSEVWSTANIGLFGASISEKSHPHKMRYVCTPHPCLRLDIPTLISHNSDGFSSQKY
jgi:hypothetical protein